MIVLLIVPMNGLDLMIDLDATAALADLRAEAIPEAYEKHHKKFSAYLYKSPLQGQEKILQRRAGAPNAAAKPVE